jgi:hypothetical protein
MFTTDVKGIRTARWVGGIPGTLKENINEWQIWGGEMECRDYLQPINDFVVCETEYKLVNDTIHAYGAADELKLCIVGVIENEMIAIECS